VKETRPFQWTADLRQQTHLNRPAEGGSITNGASEAEGVVKMPEIRVLSNAMIGYTTGPGAANKLDQRGNILHRSAIVQNAST
jgi:hypothetical protein